MFLALPSVVESHPRQIFNHHRFGTLPAWLNCMMTSLIGSFYAESVPNWWRFNICSLRRCVSNSVPFHSAVSSLPRLPWTTSLLIPSFHPNGCPTPTSWPPLTRQWFVLRMSVAPPAAAADMVSLSQDDRRTDGQPSLPCDTRAATASSPVVLVRTRSVPLRQLPTPVEACMHGRVLARGLANIESSPVSDTSCLWPK